MHQCQKGGKRVSSLKRPKEFWGCIRRDKGAGTDDGSQLLANLDSQKRRSLRFFQGLRGGVGSASHFA